MSLPSYVDDLTLSGLDLNDQSSLRKEIISLCVAFMTLVSFVTGLRMSIRLFMIHAAGIDDYLMLLATIFTVILCSCGLLGGHFGLGTHIWLLSTDILEFLHKTERITQSLYGCYLAYATAITLTKCSIIVSYLRIFPTQNVLLRRLILSTGALVIMMWICSIFVVVFQCSPVSAAWDWTLSGRCVDVLAFFYVSSGIGIATDLFLWVVPLPMFWGMNLRRQERVCVCALFGFGFFACIASILRLSQLRGLHSKDITYTSVASLDWSVAEVSTAIVCACVPSMRPLAIALLPKTWHSSFPKSHFHSTKSGTTTPGPFELVETPTKRKVKFTVRGEDDDEYDDWQELRSESGSKGTQSVDLREILEESRIDVEARSPPPTAGRDVVMTVHGKS